MIKKNPNKVPRETLLDEINKLIDWYEKFKPERGKRIQVNCSRKELAKYLSGKPAKELREIPLDDLPEQCKYRGREIVAVEKSA